MAPARPTTTGWKRWRSGRFLATGPLGQLLQGNDRPHAGAAGVIESALCVLAARAHVMPGTPGFSHPDPDAPVHLASTPRRSVPYRRILKTNSGFGGTNGALVLEITPRDT